jgi:hypothetical protein
MVIRVKGRFQLFRPEHGQFEPMACAIQVNSEVIRRLYVLGGQGAGSAASPPVTAVDTSTRCGRAASLAMLIARVSAVALRDRGDEPPVRLDPRARDVDHRIAAVFVLQEFQMRPRGANRREAIGCEAGRRAHGGRHNLGADRALAGLGIVLRRVVRSSVYGLQSTVHSRQQPGSRQSTVHRRRILPLDENCMNALVQ